VGLVALGRNDGGLELLGELVGVAHRPARPIREGLQAVVLVALEDLVAGLAGDAELPAEIGHALAFEAASDETEALLHSRTLLPGHRHLPPALPSEKCYPCVRTFCHLCLGSLNQGGRPGLVLSPTALARAGNTKWRAAGP
jgi:hypothetical protein